MRIKNEKHLNIAEQIIGNLDESGYLRRELFNIVDDLAFSQNILTSEEEIEQVLFEVQELDPSGVGARDLQECLLIQLRKKKTTTATKTAEAILEKCFESFKKKHYKKIEQKLDIDTTAIKEAMAEIVKLNPKPGNSLIDTTKSIQHITPDFTITENEGILAVELNQRNAPQLKVSRDYVEMIKGYDNASINHFAASTFCFINKTASLSLLFFGALS